jgi:outer membrane receptor protein involved in Fe transport
VLGYRHDDNSKYGTSTNPRLAMMYKIAQNCTFRASYGESFKAPTPSAMYRSIAYLDTKNQNKIAYSFVPNINLKPEKIRSYELGLRYTKYDISLDLSAYYNVMSNLIVLALADYPLDTNLYPNPELPNVNQYYATRTYRNTNQESYLYGLQLTATAKNIYKPLKLEALIDVNISKGTENFSGVPIDFRQLPKYFIQSQISFEPFRSTAICFDYVYSSSWLKKYFYATSDANADFSKISGYFTLDASVNYFFNKHFTASLKILNVFNTTYAGISATGSDSDLLYNPQTLRNIRIGLSYRFE